LLTGTLHRDSAARTGKSGAVFVTAQLRYRSGQETGFASLIAFAEEAKNELLAKNGDVHPSLEITAVKALALRQPKLACPLGGPPRLNRS